MKAVKTPEPFARLFAQALIDADYEGQYSHGIRRLEFFLQEIGHGICVVDACPEILKETPATAWVDGNNGLGVVVGTFCMDAAIRKAKQVGVGFVGCKRSNHFGMARTYTQQAMKEGLLGLTFTNTLAAVAPPGTEHAIIGTNPFSLAAPGSYGDSFVMDMAVSAVSHGHLELTKLTNSEIPSEWAVPKTGALRFLGADGSEYKGFGLALFVEILSAILGGAAYSPFIRKIGMFDKETNLGQCFIAVDPNVFAPGFEERLTDFLDSFRCLETTDPNKPVRIPGDLEKDHMKAVDEAGGVRYVLGQIEICQKIAQDLNVKPPQHIIK